MDLDAQYLFVVQGAQSLAASLVPLGWLIEMCSACLEVSMMVLAQEHSPCRAGDGMLQRNCTKNSVAERGKVIFGLQGKMVRVAVIWRSGPGRDPSMSSALHQNG